MDNRYIIAIDGPAGSGKSTVSRIVARRLGLLYVDTGAMYRAVTVKAVDENADLNDEKSLVEIAQRADINLIEKDGSLQVFLDGKDVTKRIREPELTSRIKYIAKVPGVRACMVKLQRKVADQGKGAVLEGRDIGTVVFPNTANKFYLDASIDERARRRYKELADDGQKVDLAELKRDIEARDESDKKRAVAPLKAADDAKRIDTTNMSIEEVASKILSLIR